MVHPQTAIQQPETDRETLSVSPFPKDPVAVAMHNLMNSFQVFLGWYSLSGGLAESHKSHGRAEWIGILKATISDGYTEDVVLTARVRIAAIGEDALEEFDRGLRELCPSLALEPLKAKRTRRRACA
jgi:hypothetical protein